VKQPHVEAGFPAESDSLLQKGWMAISEDVKETAQK